MRNANSTSESPSPSVRKHRPGLSRSAAACERCRRRKQKCDSRTPTCGPCSIVGVTCVPSRRLTVQNGGPDCECDVLRSQLQSLQAQYDSVVQEVDQLRSERLSRALQYDISLPDTVPTANDSHHGRAQDAYTTHHSPPNADVSYTGRILRPTFTPRPNLSNGRNALSSAWALWGNDAPAEVSTLATSSQNLESGPDNAAITNLVDVFFELRCPYLPIFHKPSFLNDHLTPFIAESVTHPLSNFLVNMACAVAATERPTKQHEDHRTFFKRAIQHLHIVMQADDFDCVQCLLLLCMYGHNEPQSVNMWYTTGLTLQLAIGLDLHRKESLNGKNLWETEMSKRVFWCAYVMNCNMAINMGRPLGLHQEDITTPLPLQLTDQQLDESFTTPAPSLLPSTSDTSTFIHVIRIRLLNAKIYTSFHSPSQTCSQSPDPEPTRTTILSDLNHWLITAPRYTRTTSTFQSQEWFQIAFHHAVLSLYRPSRAIPMPSSPDLRLCLESAIGLISSYSSLYARNQVKYTFVAIHALFMAAVTMLYALRASPFLRHDLTKPVVQTNILTFLTLFRGISNGRAVGERCSSIIERLGNSILMLFDEGDALGGDLDTEFQSWFGLQTHSFPTPGPGDVGVGVGVGVGDGLALGGGQGEFPDYRIEPPWAELFGEGVGVVSTDLWNFIL
ncbi:fungal-specific transcription factor domain-containing protein [Aspergillus karnatakaensis]|uniref:transcription factor domain-containing protein n=1 Tax=Aspergillus karnatakaensis TaxID=1810916 RepID=UPI003CCE4680